MVSSQPFFWKKLDSDDLVKTIWNDLPSGSPSLDLGDLEETFMMGAPSAAPSKMSILAKKNQPVTLLDISEFSLSTSTRSFRADLRLFSSSARSNNVGEFGRVCFLCKILR